MSKQIMLLGLTLLLTGCSGGTNPISTDESRSGSGTSATSWRDPVSAPPPPANMPPANSPLFFSAAAQEYAYGQGRGIDQLVNLDYLATQTPVAARFIANSEPFDDPFWHDPYVANWGETGGDIEDVVISNRYGARLNARLYGPRLPFADPVTGRTSSGPFPAIVFVPGDGGDLPESSNDHFSSYEGMLEQLAEHGYIVLAVNPQGQGGSDHFESSSPYCDSAGAWKQAQELGLIEQGACAGQEAPSPPYSGNNAALYSLLRRIPLVSAFLGQAQLEPQAALSDTVLVFEGFRPRFVFPAFDALPWLLSSQNPWRSLVDGERIGIAGHSAGADAAVVAGNGDPQHRYKAAAAWDTYGLPPDTAAPTIPTLLVRSELQPYFGPYRAPPHDEYFPAYRIASRFINDGKSMMALTLRGSSHLEFGYIPFALLDPLTGGPLGDSSSKGGQVCLYYTIAWFDRWLKGATPGSSSNADAAAQIASARARLLARSFDDSADRTSLGQGTYNLLTRKNVPYKIAGERAADHLTFFLHSQVSFDGISCFDWQAGCGNP